MANRFEDVLELRVELRGIEPTIWRRVQVPGTTTFWELHSVIQDAMGWLDGHLHAFVVRDPGTGMEEWVGVPDPESLEPMTPGWDVDVREYLTGPGASADYLYDFGDGWEHKVTLQKIVRRDPAVKYPRCTGGKRACPPEDCGGVWGYRDIVSGDPEAREAYPDDDPVAFDLNDVLFDDPEERRRYLEEWADL